MAAIGRSTAERLQAWLVTGPPGHLWSALADVVVLVTRERPWRQDRNR